VESHTATHRVLQTLSDEELERELVESKRTLEAELDEPIRAIAYPTGVGVGQHTKIGRAVRAAGYDLGFSGNGLCRLGETTDPLDLRRVGVDLHVPEAYFRACVVLPPLGFR
jgi:Polysaccharide deacetylase